jgi:hypothetical protein
MFKTKGGKKAKTQVHLKSDVGRLKKRADINNKKNPLFASSCFSLS